MKNKYQYPWSYKFGINIIEEEVARKILPLLVGDIIFHGTRTKGFDYIFKNKFLKNEIIDEHIKIEVRSTCDWNSFRFKFSNDYHILFKCGIEKNCLKIYNIFLVRTKDILEIVNKIRLTNGKRPIKRVWNGIGITLYKKEHFEILREYDMRHLFNDDFISYPLTKKEVHNPNEGG